MFTSWMACKKFNVFIRLALVVLVALLATPIQRAYGQEPDLTASPRLVMKWKWGTGPGTDGILNRPWSLVVDREGTIYVADTFNNRIQKFDARGNWLLSWGSYGEEEDQFMYPEAIAFDQDGNLLVSDTLNWRTERYSPQGVYLSTITSPIGFYYHRQTVVDPQGNIYIADASNYRIQKFDSQGKFLRTWNTGRCGYITPAGMALDGKGHLLVMNASCDSIETFSLDGEYLSAWSAGPEGNNTSQLSGMALDSKGRLLVVDEFHALVRIYTLDGELLGSFGSYGSKQGELNHPAGIAVGPDDKIYIADNQNNRIQVFDSTGKFLWMISDACRDCMNNPDGVATNRAGLVYVADSGNNRVLIFNRSGEYQGQIGSAGSAPGEFYFPNQNDLEFDCCDNLYVADSWNNRIQMFDPQGRVKKIWQNAGGYNIALGKNGSVYLAYQDNQIQKFDSQGNLVLSWGSYGSGPGQFDLPAGLETDLDGDVWVGDMGTHRVQKFDAQGNFLFQWAPPNAEQDHFIAEDFAVDPLGRMLILDSFQRRILVLDRSGRSITQWSLMDLTNNEMGSPNGMAFDRWGNLYVTDGTNGQVFRFQLRPYDVDASDLAENSITGQGIATLSANAPGNTDPYQYALVDGPGGEDNPLFVVEGSQVRRTGASGGENATYRIRVQVTNPWGDSYEKAVTLTSVDTQPYYLPVIRR